MEENFDLSDLAGHTGRGSKDKTNPKFILKNEKANYRIKKINCSQCGWKKIFFYRIKK